MKGKIAKLKRKIIIYFMVDCSKGTYKDIRRYSRKVRQHYIKHQKYVYNLTEIYEI